MKPLSLAALAFAAVLAAPSAGAAPAGAAPALRAPAPTANTIHVIAPYKHHGIWVFDDPRRGLVQEAFVSGADDWMERMAATVPGGRRGFTLLFSAEPFPGAQRRMVFRRAESGGAWYYDPQAKMEGWLCSTLFRYFSAPPREIYAQVKPRAG